MTNFQVYRKVLSFSFLMFLVDLFGLILLGGSATAGYFIANKSSDMALIGLTVGFVIGIILAVLVNIFIASRIKAAQIAMMVKGVTEGSLPDNTFSAGFAEIKGRFGSIIAFYLVTNAIKAIFNQISRGINKIGTALGGQTGNAITSTIDSAIQTLLSYLCDCCLGWILYRKDVSTAKAGCEGAVIFFKHGKTLIRNIGRIFGMGFLSLILIGGAFFGIATFMIIAAAFVGIALWAILHSVLIRPFILTGVMRNYMASGIADIPTEKDFAELDSKSPRFAKLHRNI